MCLYSKYRKCVTRTFLKAGIIPFNVTSFELNVCMCVMIQYLALAPMLIEKRPAPAVSLGTIEPAPLSFYIYSDIEFARYMALYTMHVSAVGSIFKIFSINLFPARARAVPSICFQFLEWFTKSLCCGATFASIYI